MAQDLRLNTIVISAAVLLWMLMRKAPEASAAEIPEPKLAITAEGEEAEAEEFTIPSAMPTIPFAPVAEEIEPAYEAEELIYIQYPGLSIWVPTQS